MSVTIVEVLRRADQGMTRPFLCRGDDDVLYYVKGRGAGLRSMCCEWVAGRLAQEMKLPVPRFEIAEVPAALVAGSDRDDIRELGSGAVFASARVEGAGEITWSEAMGSPEGMMAGVLLFELVGAERGPQSFRTGRESQSADGTGWSAGAKAVGV